MAGAPSVVRRAWCGWRLGLAPAGAVHGGRSFRGSAGLVWVALGVSPSRYCTWWILLSRGWVSNATGRVRVYIAYVTASPQCPRCGELLTEAGERGGSV